MEKFNENLSKVKDHINKLKLDFKEINKEDILSAIKEKRYLIASIVIFTIVLLTVSIKGFVMSKNELIKDLEKSVKKGNVGKIHGDIFVFDEKVSRGELKPLLEYYNEENEKINILLSELRANGTSGVFTIKTNKKGIWENYYLEVDTVGIEVDCNFSNSKIFINNEEIKSGNVKRGLIPGIYTVKAELETTYGIVEKEVEVSLMQNEKVTIKLDAIDLIVKSNFNDATVLINDENIKKNVSEFESLNPIPTKENIFIQLEREFPWGTIKSEKVKVSGSPNINLDINMVNEELITQIELAIDTFYTSVFQALNKKDSELISLADEEVQKKIYDEINKRSLILQNNYEIRGLETKIENSEFKYGNDTYVAQVVVKINYSIYKKLFSLFQSEEENMFLTNMELVGEEWVVKGIQKFELE